MTRAISRRWLLTTALAFAAVVLFLSPTGEGCVVSADAAPLDYCYFMDISVENTSGVTTYTNYPVLVEMNAAALVAAGQLDDGALGLKATVGSFSNEINVLAQDLDQSDAEWWFQVPEIGPGETKTVRLYMGNSEQRRNQGVLFAGDDDAFASNFFGTYDIADNLRVDVELETLTNPPSDGTIINQWISDTGWRLRITGPVGARRLEAQVNDQTVDMAIPFASNTNRLIRMEFAAPVLTLTDVGSGTSASNNAAGASITPARDGGTWITTNVGTDLSDTIIRELTVFDSGSVASHWGFDAANASLDGSGMINYEPAAGGVEMVHQYTRDQSDFTVTVGALQLTSAATGGSVPDTVVDLLGDPFASDLFEQPDANQFGPDSSFLAPPANTGIPASLWWSIILGSIGLLLAAVVLQLTSNIMLSLLAAGMPIGYGVINGYLPAWWLVMWVLLVVGVYGTHMWSEKA